MATAARRPSGRPSTQHARPSLRLVPGTVRSGLFRGPAFMAGIVGAVLGLVFGLVLTHIYLAQTSFQVQEIQAKMTAEENRYRQTRFEIAQAESPGVLAQKAAELGLVAPGRQEFIQGRPTFQANPGDPVATLDDAVNIKAITSGRG